MKIKATIGYGPTARCSGRKKLLKGELAFGMASILLVDDEFPILQMGIHMLDRMGYRATAYIDGTHAFAEFESNPEGFDLLIADLYMPEMSGLELASRCKAIRLNLPVIICSGYSHMDPEFPRKMKAIGIDALLAKPFGYNDLSNIVRSVLDIKGETLPA
jgi:DNA-binding NtrC family response regulator